MTILPDDVILMMKRHNGWIDGDTSTNMVDKESLTQHIVTQQIGPNVVYV